MSLSNLPPGVSDSDIPGNRPEDAAYERAANSFYELLIEWDVNPDDPRDVFSDAFDELVTGFLFVVQRFSIEQT